MLSNLRAIDGIAMADEQISWDYGMICEFMQILLDFHRRLIWSLEAPVLLLDDTGIS